jgi:SAM-dependent methyltransferase
MQTELIEILRCPKTGERLILEEPQYKDEQIQSGWLVAESGKHRYPIRDFIPRFAPESNYADNFGMQWNAFRKTQLDSYSGQPISAKRFWVSTGWRPEDFAGKYMLDAGCGAGRFAEIALQAGAKLVALDYSNAVDACYANLKHYPNLHVVQGNIYELPFPKGFFPFVYSFGVLMCTPNVEQAFAEIPPMVAPGGRLCVDFYGLGFGTLFHAKWVFRPITKRIRPQALFRFLQSAVPVLLPVSQLLGSVPGVGVFLKRMIPVANHTGVYPLTAEQVKEWALLDTFDMLAPKYDHPKPTAGRLRRWLEAAGLADVEVFRAGHLIGRGSQLPRA